MKRITVAFSFLIMAFTAAGQVYDPVTWSFSYEKKGDRIYELIFSAAIEDESHIYAMEVPENGPIPTTVQFDTLPGFRLDGKPFEVTKPEEKFDEAFGFKIKSFSGTAEIRQRIIAEADNFTVTGFVNYMVCNKATCLPPKDAEFSFNISGKSPEPAMSDTGRTNRGILGFFITSFLLGLVGVVTPCVYPMIPMTVAFFTRDAGNRSRGIFNALIFGLSIVLIYTSPGIIISLTGAGAGFANALSTHWIPNLIFFMLFVLFATSFFGAFELVLPGSWSSRTDARVDKGGILASFFMALTTVIVSFSCTGPIIGSLLVEASRGDILRPTIGMFAFGLAFALPFTLFALFPAVLSKLPKSGGWLNSVKIVLGFLMLAFSLKFLSTIDTVYGFKLISRDIYLAIWIVLFSLMGLYLMGKIRFAHDSEHTHLGTFRLFLVIATFSFVVYLIPGLFGAPLKGLSSLLPSAETAWFNTGTVSISRSQPSVAPAANMDIALTQTCSETRFGDKFQLPYGLKGFFDYKQGLACAKEMGKPVFIDFKGHACANCKLMEAKVWSDPAVLQRLRDNFVIVALYTDDRTQLPENEWITSSVDGKVKKTIGRINEDLEITRFGTNAIPLYVIADHKGNPLIEPMATNFNIAEYIRWLDAGLEAFRNRK